uniref:DNA polymerase n=1 Tax=Aureoboletus raphanaceus TaxID=2591536 RepID=UPI0025520044|nr:DNA polymerase [Aureoboletus raphanaceus]WGL38732.1 DNA polymerase [Aureoboletus raphanaceus]
MNDYFYDLKSEVLVNNTNYLQFFDKFWNDVMSDLDPNQNVMVRFLIQMSDTSARTLNKTEIISNNVESLNSFKELLIYNLNNIYAHYLSNDEDNMILGFIMRYKIFSSKSNISETVTKKAIDIKKGRIQRTVKIRNINYPLSTNTYKFGNTQYKVNNLTFVLNSDKGLKFEFDRKVDSQIIKVFKNNNLINTFIDTFIDLNNNLFKRTINNLVYYIKDGKVILKTKEYNPNFIKKAKIDKQFTNNIYTADIETLTKIDDKKRRYFEPYSVAFFDGNKSKNYYVTDYNNWEEMRYRFWNDLFFLKLKNVDIYYHNLSGFDINFLLKPLLNIEGVESEIMLREGKWISVKIKYGASSFIFKDSLLLLPGSLMNLSKSFKIDTPKEIFPRKLFEKETFESDYVSDTVPNYEKYFNHSEVSLDDYNNYCELFRGKSWSLKDETLKYADIDCIALHQILIKFGNMIFDRWGIDIKHTPTLPALCFKIYRSKYMPKETIPIIIGIPFRDIKQSYTGGATDMYIPYGENIWCYDINSLYPTAMHNFKFPVGNFIAFNNVGKLSWNELEVKLGRKLFGFVEVEVDCPLSIKHPILQIRRDIEINSPRTFAPVGKFTGWFHTEEIINAMKYGYTFKVISGYLFEEDDIFINYIEDLYRIKVDADKNKDPVWRLISKNLMNSLYGRFGMDQYLVNSSVIDKNEIIFKDIITHSEIDDVIELDDKLLIQYLPKGYKSFSYQEKLDINISIAIASSVTAYSRILMSQYKNNPNFDLFYSDTDSLYVNFKSNEERLIFESKYVDPLKLGSLKVENLKKDGNFIPYERFYFFGPKFYVAIFDGNIDFANKTKIRGLQKAYRSSINEDMIKSLMDYNRKPIKIETMKWFKEVSTSKIFIDNRPYNLDISVNKRSLVYQYNSP